MASVFHESRASHHTKKVPVIKDAHKAQNIYLHLYEAERIRKLYKVSSRVKLLVPHFHDIFSSVNLFTSFLTL
jgi:hypothetical protein